MLLTRKELRRILASFRVRVPAEVEKELLAEYGNPVTDDEGRVREYTEQDIYEQLRKRLYHYQSSQQVRDESVMRVG
ncbi:MAG TPA: hypothetical protein VJA25_15385 [Dehalococcoidia bacterium]|nr:hypothetical protein [Dehalococcoidia bacterium]